MSDGILRFGYINPTVARYEAVPRWEDANPKLLVSQWEEHDDYAKYWPAIRAQQNNNCTNAALSPSAEALMKSVGIEDVPELSWSYLYAQCNGNRDQGAVCRDVIAAALLGMATREAWSDDRIYAPRGGFPKAVVDEAGQWRLLEVYQCMDWADVMSALSRRFHVYHGFVLGSSFNRVGPDGIVPKWDGRRRNGHAMTSRGLRRVNGVWRTVTPNTWGRPWGDDGVGYWDESYFWEGSGNYVNLDAYAVRSVMHVGSLPTA